MLILLRGGPGAGKIVDRLVDLSAPDPTIGSGEYTGGLYRIAGTAPAGSAAAYVADWTMTAHTPVRSQMAHFETQHSADQGTIAELQAGGIVDRAVIEHLLSDGLIDRNKIANLELGLASARRIGAAIGIVMATKKVTEDQAFSILRRISETKHRKLRDVAEDVLLTGHIDSR